MEPFPGLVVQACLAVYFQISKSKQYFKCLKIASVFPGDFKKKFVNSSDCWWYLEYVSLRMVYLCTVLFDI